MPKRTFATIVVATAVLIAAACGSSEPTETAGTSDPEPTTLATAAPDDPEPVLDTDSPIEALLGVPVFDDDAMNDWFAELDIERKRKTAECMIAQGFEYVPQTAPQAQGPVVEYATSSREYAETYGFGIGYAFNAAEYDPTATYETANSIYIAGLSEGEKAAYYGALYGPNFDDQNSEGVDEDFFPEGCEGDSFREVFSILGVMDQLGPIVDGYYEQFLADSRMIELTSQWQRCMSEAGFTFSHADDMLESFYVELDAIVSNPAAYEQTEVPDDLPEPDFVFSGDVYGFHPKLNAQGQGELDSFIANEIKSAVSHWDCQAPLQEEELNIQREYEAKFVDEAAPLVAGQLDG